MITITAAAASYINKMIAKENSVGFRLSVKKTGCSGFSYVPAIIQQIDDEDIFIANDYGLAVYVEKKSLAVLTGLTIDYVEDNKMGLKQKQLSFINPNEASRCGCGESFNLKEDDHVS